MIPASPATYHNAQRATETLVQARPMHGLMQYTPERGMPLTAHQRHVRKETFRAIGMVALTIMLPTVCAIGLQVAPVNAIFMASAGFLGYAFGKGI